MKLVVLYFSTACLLFCLLVSRATVVLLLYPDGSVASRVMFCESAYMVFQMNVPDIVILCIKKETDRGIEHIQTVRAQEGDCGAGKGRDKLNQGSGNALKYRDSGI